MTGRAQEEMMMTTGQLASAGSSALEVTAPDETHIPAWPPPVPREIGTLPLSRLRRVTDYIREHLDQDLTLAQLGGVVYMTPSHFSTVFRRLMGVTPHEYRVKRLEGGRDERD